MAARIVWTLVAAAAVCAGSRASAQTAVACGRDIPQQLRVLDCRLATALHDALPRSASLRDMVRRIGELKGIVYVSTPMSLPSKKLVGGLAHNIISAGTTRILHIMLINEHSYGDRAVATLAHEVRHALEILESPETRTEADVGRLYDRIGYMHARGVIETHAALAMGDVVRKELKESAVSKK